MTRQTNNLELLLADLGRAQNDGAFVRDARPYPWLAAQTEVKTFGSRRLAWIRVAAPVAAAAAVAVLFVLPGLWVPQATQQVAENMLSADMNAKPALPAPQPQVATNQAVDCDFNGDRVVDGKDIQAFVDRLNDGIGDPVLEAEQLRRCLLSSH